MGRQNKHGVCPVENAGGLDNIFRRLIQNPKKLLRPYLVKGMTIIDFGCGPGIFTIGMAELVGETGHIIAADLQEGMLSIVKNKLKNSPLQNRIELHQCKTDSTGILKKADFILAFYVIHEVPDRNKLFEEFKNLLKPEGKILIVEPNFHVSKIEFSNMTEDLKKQGFKIITNPKIFMSRTALLKI